MKLPPSIHGTGHRDGNGTVSIDVPIARPSPLGLQGQATRGATRPVQANHLLGLGVPQHGETVAAYATGHRLQKSERRIGGDGGIDR